ncbi:MAG TPA: succinate dehydrogenase, cytochrome b556 subunit [Devosia sp.]|nr:succinate dehydrogenase, cytochrome b556 subunit [Devosia sp.]
MPARSRPLSPHLSIYRFTLTMANSVIHRGTGMAMYAGTLLIVLWLGAAALGEGPFALVSAVYGFWLVQAVFFLATWALFHHMLGGIRHFVWDSIHALDPMGRETITRVQWALSIILTLGAWALFVWFK